MPRARFSGTDGGVSGPHSSLCGRAAGGPGEGLVADVPPGRPLPQSGHQRPVFAAPPQHGYDGSLSGSRGPSLVRLKRCGEVEDFLSVRRSPPLL